MDMFSKKQIVKSEKYKDYRDVLSALLIEGIEYSFEEIDNIIEQFGNKVLIEGSEAQWV